MPIDFRENEIMRKGENEMDNEIKVENWNGYNIRFVNVNGEWQAVMKDVCDACDLKTNGISRRLSKDVISNHPLLTKGGYQEMLLINEYGIYDLVFQSKKPQAKEFRLWVYKMLSELRKATGLEGFEVFRMLDKEHQKEAMAKLQQGLSAPKRVDFIKANTITDKAISNKYGYPKMVKKDDMTPSMLADREPILNDTVELMTVHDKYGIPESVSKEIYKRYSKGEKK